MNFPAPDSPPPKILTARRKRAFLSFRRRMDLFWFLLSVILFSAGAAALGVSLWSVRRLSPPPVVSSFDEPSSPVSPPSIPMPSAALSPPFVAKASTASVVSPGESRPSERVSSRPSPPVVSRRVFVEKKNFLTTPKTGAKLLPKLKTPTSPAPHDPSYRLPLEGRSFKWMADGNAKGEVVSIMLAGEPVVQMSYDLSQGDWIQCYLNVRENFSGYSRVQFFFSVDGSANTLEFKLVDADGTNRGALWPRQTARSGWTVVDLGLSDLAYFWGSSPTLDLTRIRQICFAVSKKQGDQGGRGRVFLRRIRFL